MSTRRPARLALLVLPVIVFAAACSSSVSRDKSDDTTTVAVVDTSTPTDDTGTTVAADDTSTSAASTAPPTTKAPAPVTTKAPAPSGPQFASISFSSTPTCWAADAVSKPQLTVRATWSVTGADKVYVAVDDPNGVFYDNLPLQSSFDFNYACPTPEHHTYYVVAVKGSTKVVQSKTVN